jgi:ABC-type transport system involved in multi-copper enzyme maturation permease subunit
MGFWRIFILETTRFSNKKYITFILLFLLVSGYAIQFGVTQYKHMLEEKTYFQEFETGKVKQFIYVNQYSDYGVRILFIPSQMSAFFNAGAAPQHMTAFIDTSERIKIYNPLKGQNAFARFNSGFLSFSGLILLFGTFAALLYGYYTFRNQDWIQFLESILGDQKKFFAFLVVSRLLLIFLFCVLLASVSIVVFVLNGIHIPFGDISLYFLGMFSMLCCFFFMGILSGFIKNPFSSITTLVAAWLIFTILYPAIISQWTFTNSRSTQSNYKVEAEKQKLFMSFEKRSFKELGIFDQSKRGTEKEKLMFLDFWNNEFRQVMEKEQILIEELKKHAQFYQTLAGFCPSSFFISLSNEISSKGFGNLVAFYVYAQQMKRDFVWFRAENYIFSNRDDILAFIKGDENIFYGKSMLPENFDFGMAMNAIWLMVLMALSWFFFQRFLEQIPDTVIDLKPDFSKSKVTVILSNNQNLLSQLLVQLKYQKSNYVIVPSPETLPSDLRVRSIFSFFNFSIPDNVLPIAGKCSYALNREYKALVVLELIKQFNRDFIVFNNFLADLSDDFAEYFSKALKEIKKERVVVYFTKSLMATSHVADDVIRHTKEKVPY